MRGPKSFRTFYDLGLRPFLYGNAGFRRSQVNTNNFAHVQYLLLIYCSARSAGPSPVSQLRSTTSVNAQRDYEAHSFRLYKNGLRGLQASEQLQFLRFNRIPCGEIIKMIVSASYRTDIPSFYRTWFMNQFAIGNCKAINP